MTTKVKYTSLTDSTAWDPGRSTGYSGLDRAASLAGLATGNTALAGAADIWAPAKSVVLPLLSTNDAIFSPETTAKDSGSGDVPEENGDASVTVAVAATGNALIDGVLSGVRWNETFITYSDTDSSADYQAGYTSDQNGNGISAQNEAFSQFTAAQMVAFHAALNQAVYTQLGGAGGFSVEGFTNLGIDYNGAGTSNSTIRAANSGDAGTAYAFYPSNAITGGDTFFGNAYDGTSNSLKNPVAGNYAWHTMIHELGHSLGLKHGHQTGGPANTAVPAAYNSVEFTVMTYASYIGDSTGGYDYEQWGAPQTYMMIDILALQTMYGADFTVNSGNTVYTWDPTNGNSYVGGVLAIDPGGNRIFSTIWDGDGVDTYDLSNYTTNLRLDLRPGESSTFSSTQLAYLGGGPNGGYARGNVFNAFQFNGDSRSLIENANGGSGNDSIIGNSAGNVLNGNGGNDTIDGNGGVDTVNGQAGNDTFLMDSGDGIDNFNGGADTDTINFAGLLTNFVVVDLVADTWDFLGGGGTLGTAISIENIIGTAGNDTLIGDTSANNLSGQAGDDSISGGDGNDVLSGNGGADSIQGGTGADTLDGGDGNDVLQGGDGDDTLTAGSGVDLVYGNSGNDRFFIVAGWNGGVGEAFFGGAGYDTFDTSTVIFSGFDAYINLQDGEFYDIDFPGSGPISLASVEKAITGDGNDVLIGSAEANALLAGAGNDTISGLAGNDTLGGGDGNDRLDGGAGADYLSGGTGSDTADYSSSSVGLGVSLFNPAVNTGDAAGDTYNSIENLFGSNFNDGLNGNTGINTIRGRDGGDTLKGYAGNDSLYGDGGNDTLIGGEGADNLLGGAGSDTASYRDATAAVIASLANSAINTGEALGDVYTSIENIVGSNFNDLVYGNANANSVSGGSGNDILKGYAGNDTLSGGSGNDQFNFNTALNAATNMDIITDFNVAADTILLDNAVFIAAGALGTLAAAAFKANTTGLATDASDRIIYETDTGELFYDADGNGGGASIQFAKLAASLALTNADFVIV
ncbi:M10 family metallopeptidase C-terminal domain-containing protein [Pararhizobium sp. O133]|uniref:M10 family metallopeptidase C-terminal domain-containing protein n=1 Tax=Pararhizobium sp. O133 TaxID=3449278 RepID=UPI003F688ED2